MTGLVLYLNWLFDFSFSVNFFPQLIVIYTLYLLIKSRNIFYSLIYVFLELIFFGIFIAFYQMELYTGFLWVAEFSIFLVFLILLIYLNSDGYSKNNNNFSNIKNYYFIVLFIPIIFIMRHSSNHMPYDFLFDYNSLWDDYYEALNNVSTNDFNGLFTSYYTLNSFEFLIFAILLFAGTLLCISLYKVFYTFKTTPYSRFFSIFNFFSLKINYNFLRQQNLHKQTRTPASNRVLKKK